MRHIVITVMLLCAVSIEGAAEQSRNSASPAGRPAEDGGAALREQPGYRGMIITDSLVRRGALETTGSLSGARIQQALDAGRDKVHVRRIEVQPTELHYDDAAPKGCWARLERFVATYPCVQDFVRFGGVVVGLLGSGGAIVLGTSQDGLNSAVRGARGAVAIAGCYGGFEMADRWIDRAKTRLELEMAEENVGGDDDQDDSSDSDDSRSEPHNFSTPPRPTNPPVVQLGSAEPDLDPAGIQWAVSDDLAVQQNGVHFRGTRVAYVPATDFAHAPASSGIAGILTHESHTPLWRE